MKMSPTLYSIIPLSWLPKSGLVSFSNSFFAYLQFYMLYACVEQDTDVQDTDIMELIY